MSSQSNTYQAKHRHSSNNNNHRERNRGRGRGRGRVRNRGNKNNNTSPGGRGAIWYNKNYNKTKYRYDGRSNDTQRQYKNDTIHFINIGFKLSLFENQNSASHYQCGICHQVCRNAVQLSCYECNNDDNKNDKDLCYCQSCLNTYLNTNNYTCPLNKNHKNVSYKHSKHIRHEINNLIINCPSCKWKNTVYKFQFHSNKQCKINSPLSQRYQQNIIKQGQCYLMCSHKESKLRLSNNQYHKIFECDPNNKYTKYSLIKEYIRSSAGQQIDFKEVRCASVLRLTLQYLMNIVLNNISISYISRFAFIEDRIRAIVKDIYVQSLEIHDQKTTIEIFEICIRFRIYSHVLLCHLDQHQKKSFPASTKSIWKFINMDLNEKPNKSKFYYSAARNLQHLSNIFSKLFDLYAQRDFHSLSDKQQTEQIEMYCLAAFHKLVQDVLKGIKNSQQFAQRVLCNKNVPLYVRKHVAIKQAFILIQAYSDMNRRLFFKIYSKCSIMEKAVLYPILDHFRLICIRKMCHRKCVRMPPWKLKYEYVQFVRDFYFDVVEDGCDKIDVNGFLSWFGGFGMDDMKRIVESGLGMDDLGRIKRLNDGSVRFAARDEFLLDDKTSLQSVMQGSSYKIIDEKEFYDLLGKIEHLKSVDSLNEYIETIESKR